MAGTLYLTEQERDYFSLLPKDLQAEWSVQSECQPQRDGPERRAMRLQVLEKRAPTLKPFLERAKTAHTLDALATLVLTMELIDTTGEQDFRELLSALGPAVTSRIVVLLLENAKTANDIERLERVTQARHVLTVALFTTT